MTANQNRLDLGTLRLSPETRRALEGHQIDSIEKLEERIEGITNLSGIADKRAVEILAAYSQYARDEMRRGKSLTTNSQLDAPIELTGYERWTRWHAFPFRISVFVVLGAGAILSLTMIYLAENMRPAIARNPLEFDAVWLNVLVAVCVPIAILFVADNFIFFKSGKPPHRIHWLQAVLSLVAVGLWMYMYGFGLYDILFMRDFVSARFVDGNQVAPEAENTLIVAVQSLLTRANVPMVLSIGLGLFPYSDGKQNQS